MKNCYDCGQQIDEGAWRCQECYRALWLNNGKRMLSGEEQPLMKRLADQRKQRLPQPVKSKGNQLILENQQDEPAVREWIYFISDEHNRIKIGYSSQPEKRFKSLQSANADNLTLLATTEGDRKLEGALQSQFSHFRIGETEWFVADPTLLMYIANLGD